MRIKESTNRIIHLPLKENVIRKGFFKIYLDEKLLCDFLLQDDDEKKNI